MTPIHIDMVLYRRGGVPTSVIRSYPMECLSSCELLVVNECLQSDGGHRPYDNYCEKLIQKYRELNNLVSLEMTVSGIELISGNSR